MRLPTPLAPDDTGTVDGLAYTLWLPSREVEGRLVILHGAGSCKESHHDFARAAREAGLATLCFDQRGHGDSGGALDSRAVADIEAVTKRGHSPFCQGGPLYLRGSSMGGYLALVAAASVGADAVVAICPATSEGLLRGLRSGDFEFEADRPSLESFLEVTDVAQAVAEYEGPILLLHAEGDERVPVESSRRLAALFRNPASRYIEVPGGHHRSVQHDGELQGLALRWLARLRSA